MKIFGKSQPEINPAAADNVAKPKPKHQKPPAKVPDFRGLSADEIKAAAGGNAQQPKVVRTRFAPSPTGHLHIGGARTALMNYLFAKKMGGEFVLRVEDTDQLRSKQEYTDAIVDGLKWLGINSDADLVFQSQRAELYKQKTDALIQAGKAYQADDGAVYFKMPTEGNLVVNDRVKGRCAVGAGAEGTGDFVIRRSDGTATFLLANVVDDGEMGITHIIRGDDHLTNAARQIPLYQALGYNVPQFYHVPLIFGDDGHKLSKRHGATSVIDYQEKGYEAEAVVNHLARLGMSFETDAVLPTDKLAEALDPWGFNKSPSQIDFPKLDHVNKTVLAGRPVGELVKELKTRDPELHKRLGDTGAKALVEGARGRATTHGEVVEIGRFILDEPVFHNDDKKVYDNSAAKKYVQQSTQALRGIADDNWTTENITAVLDQMSNSAGKKSRAVMKSMRWFLTGITEGLPLDSTMVILGKEETLKRLNAWVG